ncbi:HAD family hydrolase [Streptomyces sp. Sce081]|uniref:HAD family hydrolase n=1 Tax=Streptomyces sp. Sce081 TaxID=3349853 RepID=UPI0035F23076
MTPTGEVRGVLSAARSVLLDFDGPVCQVFSGMSAAEVARRLRSAYGDAARLAQGDDPLEVVRTASMDGLPRVDALESALTDLEVAAVEMAAPTAHAEAAIKALHAAGHQLAAVSNNSTAALKRYFTSHGLDPYVSPLIGREAIRIRQMKPAPHMLLLALEAHGVSPQAAVLVGDSVSDIQAAHAAGAMSIGYANKPGKYERLRKAGATVVIEDMADLACASWTGAR